MREHRLLQRRRSEGRRRRPGFFRVERPDQLWHLDMTSVWVAEHGWCYLNAAIDCCTREITAWALDVRCRAPEAIAVIEAAAVERGVVPGRLTLGTDNGSAFTSRAFRRRLGELGITHRRGGYRDPESQAFIESWFSKLKQRCIWREEFETLDQARAAIGAYVVPGGPRASARRSAGARRRRRAHEPADALGSRHVFGLRMPGSSRGVIRGSERGPTRPY
jgi:putative transposase